MSGLQARDVCDRESHHDSTQPLGCGLVVFGSDVLGIPSLPAGSAWRLVEMFSIGIFCFTVLLSVVGSIAILYRLSQRELLYRRMQAAETNTPVHWSRHLSGTASIVVSSAFVYLLDRALVSCGAQRTSSSYEYWMPVLLIVSLLQAACVKLGDCIDGWRRSSSLRRISVLCLLGYLAGVIYVLINRADIMEARGGLAIALATVLSLPVLSFVILLGFYAGSRTGGS